MSRSVRPRLTLAFCMSHRRWHADPAHIKSQTEYIAKLTSDGGFELVEVVKLEDSALPSAANVYAALERLKATNFTEFDGLVVLIAGHSSLEVRLA